MATQPKKSRPSAARSAGRPSYVKPKVIPPGRRKNADYRTREHLTQDEVDALMEAAGKTGRHPHRDRTLILLAFRHALRVSELVSLRWSQVDFRNGILHVTRLKNGIPSTHPLHGPELRALRKLSRDYPEAPYVFVSERGGPRPEDCPSGWRKGRSTLPSTSPPTSARVWVPSREPRDRHQSDPTLLRTQVDHSHGTIHGARF